MRGLMISTYQVPSARFRGVRVVLEDVDMEVYASLREIGRAVRFQSDGPACVATYDRKDLIERI